MQHDKGASGELGDPANVSNEVIDIEIAQDLEDQLESADSVAEVISLLNDAMQKPWGRTKREDTRTTKISLTSCVKRTCLVRHMYPNSTLRHG